VKYDAEDFEAKMLRVAKDCERAGLTEAADVLRQAQERIARYERDRQVARPSRAAVDLEPLQ